MTARTSTLRFEEVEVGDELPKLEVELTPTRIIATAIASRDYQDVHHDPDLARGAGAQDIFMNILTSNGYVSRFVTDWAGPDALLKRISIGLGAPNYAHDTMKMSGRVAGKEATDDGGIVEVEVRGTNSYGDHVTGTVRVALPGTAR